LVGTFNLHALAYEFAKRKFSEKYGKDIPIWALLASGSTGGVRFLLFRPSLHVMLAEPQIAYWLSCYPLGTFTSHLMNFYKTDG